MIVPRHVLGRGHQAPSDLVNFATCGINGMGRVNTRNAASHNWVAACDVDATLMDRSIAGFARDIDRERQGRERASRGGNAERVTFTGSVGYVATSSGALGDSGTDSYVVAPGISWGIFDLGHVQARIAASKARKDTALLRYEKTVLNALEETENSMVTHARARERLVHDEAAVRASTTAADLARVRYENGASDFLQVLDAERTLLESEDRLARSRTEAATSLIAVYKALGGGWQAGAGS